MSGASKGPEDRLRLVLEGVGWESYTKNKIARFRDKPGTWWLHPSLNVWAKARNFQVRRFKDCWLEKIGRYVLEHQLARVTGQVVITVTYYFPTARPRDIDNYTPKFIMDALKQHLLDDDNSEVVTELRVKLAVDKLRPRTEIDIGISQESFAALLGLIPPAAAEAMRRDDKAIETHAAAEATGGEQPWTKPGHAAVLMGRNVPTYDPDRKSVV